MSSSLFQFTFSGTTVTSISRLEDGQWRSKSLDDPKEQWSYDPNTNIVTQIETKLGSVETNTYTDANNDNVFLKASSSHQDSNHDNFTQSTKLFDFTIDGSNNITAIRENKNGVWESKDLNSSHNTWTYDPTNQTVTKTENEHGFIETTVFTKNADGFFTRSSESFQVGDGTVRVINDDSNSDSVLYGHDESDIIRGHNGNDYIESYNGNDKLFGGKGDDYLYAGSGDDTVNGGSGDDLIVGGDGGGNDTYKGDSGNDTVKYSSATHSINVNLARGVASGIDIDNDKLSSIENIIGGSGDDTIKGNNVANILSGGDGDDSLDGVKGKDTLIGGAGNDTYYVDNAGDVITETVNDGLDSIFSTSNNFDMALRAANTENISISGRGKGNAFGNDLDNHMTGSAGSNTLDGRTGDDNIDGGAGKDLVIGGAGNDSLTGGLGADVFKWGINDHGSAGSANNDTITDFSLIQKDKLDLRDLLVGEHKNDLTNLLNFIDVTANGSNTEIRISSTGGFSGGTFNSSAENAHITLSNVNLLGSGSETDLLQSLIQHKQLIID